MEGRAAKKLKTQAASRFHHASAAMPSVESLFTTPLGLLAQPSPGAMHGCRIASVTLQQQPDQHSFASLFATGTDIFWHSVQLSAPMAGRVGKEAVMIPVRLKSAPAAKLSSLQHAGEVQGLALQQLEDGKLLLAAVDAYGQGTLSSIKIEQQQQHHHQQQSEAPPSGPGDEEQQQPAAANAAVESAQLIEPQDALREGGWAGVAFSKSQPSILAAARACARDVSVYDGASRVRTLHTVTQPYALTFLQRGQGAGGDLLSVAEGHMVSIWDVRAGEKGGCIQRVGVSSPGSPLYSLAWCSAQGGLLGAAGAERAVQMIDPRKWRCTDKWSGATRQAIHHLSFLDGDSTYACVSGLDSEVVCGCWSKPPPPVGVKPYGYGAQAAGEAGAGGGEQHQQFSFRGDSRWLGVAKAAGSDVIAGFAASGCVAYAQVAVREAVQA